MIGEHLEKKKKLKKKLKKKRKEKNTKMRGAWQERRIIKDNGIDHYHHVHIH